MLKQYIAIILLCVFNFILVGHSVVPHKHDEHNDHLHIQNHDHHHHHHHQRSTKKSEQQNKENDKKQSKGLSDFFASVIHFSEFVKGENIIRETEKNTQKVGDEISMFSFHLTAAFFTLDIKAKGILYRDPDYYPPPNSHKGLRAPPVFFS